MIQSDLCIPGTPSVLFFEATLPVKPATIALKIVHLAFQGKNQKLVGSTTVPRLTTSYYP